jgi:hypothetical protein
MTTVAAAVVRRWHAISGGTTARVVRDMGADVTSRRGPSVSAL